MRALEATLIELEGAGDTFKLDFDGKVETSTNAATILRTAMSSPADVNAVQSATGVAITDDDGDGLPDDAAQIRAVYDYATANGVGILRNDIVQSFLYVGPSNQATRLEVFIPTFTDDAIIQDGWDTLNAAATSLESQIGASAQTIAVSGPPITNKDTLDAFVASMRLSLPVAILLATLIAALVMRSIKYALVSIVPIIAVVAWVYAYMYLTGLAINPVTATIAAIAIGVGIDFATHFTVRFREEFVNEPSRFPALRRAGAGTGGVPASAGRWRCRR